MSSDSSPLSEVHHEKAPVAPWIEAAKYLRMLGRGFIVSILLNVALAVAIVCMLPLKEKEIVVVEFKKTGDNVVILEKADRNLQGNQKLISATLRMYVNDRESVDKVTEQAIRYPRVRDMSNDTVWDYFQKAYSNPEVGPFFQKGLKRAIEITSDSRLADGIHQVEFKRIDTLDGQQGEAVTKWVAVLRYGFSDRKVSEAEALRNPIGLIVTEYSIKARQE